MKRLRLLIACCLVAALDSALFATTYAFEGLGEKGTFAQGTFEVDEAAIPDADDGSFMALRNEISAFSMTLTNVPATPNAKTYSLPQFGATAFAKVNGTLEIFNISTSPNSNSYTYWVWGDGVSPSSGIYRITSTATYDESEEIDKIHWSLPTPAGGPRNQVIVAPAMDVVPANASPFSITASASSGLPVAVSVASGPATIVNGQVALTGEMGYVTLSLTQAGGLSRGQTYLAATPVELSFEVTEAEELKPQTINFPSVPNMVTASPSYLVTATASSGLPVSITVLSGPATISGKLLTLTGATGTVTLRATQAGGQKDGSFFAAASPVEQSFQVLGALPSKTQTISFPQPASATYGNLPVLLSATSSAGLPVSFDLISGPASLSGATLTLTGAGRIIVRAVQAGSEEYKPAAVSRTITVSKAPLVVSFQGASRLVRTANPWFVAMFNGFVGDDTVEDLDIQPVGTTPAKLTSAQGVYPITPRGGVDNNYRFVSGTVGSLTVEGFGGAYESLLFSENGIPRGKLTITVPSNSLSFTGVLDIAAETTPVSVAGLLAAENGESATGAWLRAKTGIPTLDLEFAIAGNTLEVHSVQRDHIAYATSIPAAPGTRVFAQRTSGKTKLPAPWTGAYTLISRAPQTFAEADAREFPQGASYASSVVASTGTLSLRGRLGDGTPLTASARAAETSEEENPVGLFPIWVRPYGKRINSFFAGTAELISHVDQPRFPHRHYQPEGAQIFFWEKAKVASDTSYPDGFAVELATTVDPWVSPVLKITAAQPDLITVAQRLGLTDTASEVVTLSATYLNVTAEILGSRAAQVPTSLILRPNGTFAVPPAAEVGGTTTNPTGFSLKFTPTTGVFEGSFVLSDVIPPATKATTRKGAVYGTLRQGPDSDAHVGHGIVLLPQLSSSLRRSFEFQLSAKN